MISVPTQDDPHFSAMKVSGLRKLTISRFRGDLQCSVRAQVVQAIDHSVHESGKEKEIAVRVVRQALDHQVFEVPAFRDLQP